MRPDSSPKHSFSSHIGSSDDKGDNNATQLESHPPPFIFPKPRAPLSTRPPRPMIKAKHCGEHGENWLQTGPPLFPTGARATASVSGHFAFPPSGSRLVEHRPALSLVGRSASRGLDAGRRASSSAQATRRMLQVPLGLPSQSVRQKSRGELEGGGGKDASGNTGTGPVSHPHQGRCRSDAVRLTDAHAQVAAAVVQPGGRREVPAWSVGGGGTDETRRAQGTDEGWGLRVKHDHQCPLLPIHIHPSICRPLCEVKGPKGGTKATGERIAQPALMDSHCPLV